MLQVSRPSAGTFVLLPMATATCITAQSVRKTEGDTSTSTPSLWETRVNKAAVGDRQQLAADARTHTEVHAAVYQGHERLMSQNKVQSKYCLCPVAIGKSIFYIWLQHNSKLYLKPKQPQGINTHRCSKCTLILLFTNNSFTFSSPCLM